MDRTERRRPASFTCGFSKKATRFGSSHAAPKRSRFVKDLVVDRSGFDRIQQTGGYISVRAGSAPDANKAPDS
jgi:hypothetical protein